MTVYSQSDICVLVRPRVIENSFIKLTPDHIILTRYSKLFFHTGS